jgi:hypothetical protein
MEFGPIRMVEGGHYSDKRNKFGLGDFICLNCTVMCKSQLGVFEKKKFDKQIKSIRPSSTHWKLVFSFFFFSIPNSLSDAICTRCSEYTVGKTKYYSIEFHHSIFAGLDSLQFYLLFLLTEFLLDFRTQYSFYTNETEHPWRRHVFE